MRDRDDDMTPEEKSAIRTPIFAYGILNHTYHASRLGLESVGHAIVFGKRRVQDGGSGPWTLEDDPHGYAVGQVWMASDDALQRIDLIEHAPDWYRRIKVTAHITGPTYGPKEMEAIAWEIPADRRWENVSYDPQP